VFGCEFYVDSSRCIGCRSCLQACEECDAHRGKSMINFDFIERKESISSAAYVCWHCDEPTCAQVCPTDAIKTKVRMESSIPRSSRDASPDENHFGLWRKCADSSSRRESIQSWQSDIQQDQVRF
jgi:ferredoxin